ncbi:IclR family transcriptional regulator [Sphingomonas montana]|uniref:IclR family transcriptional regulator n=1 Tax=Sphingomonas montana TaxID=1843236 RepID=UPI00096D1ABC|nr:IclR family transcriptional regulator [Sphingomonas montana]
MIADVTPETEEKRLRYSVPALEKGLDILEYLAEQAVPVTQAHVARALNRQPGELFRMLTCLEGRGYLHRDAGSNGYVLSLRLFELSRIHSPHEALLRAARPLMRALADEVRESCHLSVLHRGSVLVLSQEESPRAFRLSVEVGSQHPPMRTTSGRLLLAGLEPEALADTLADQADWANADETRRSGFVQQLDMIRRTGFHHSTGERFVGGADIGVLVGGHGSAVNAALTIARLIETDMPSDIESFTRPLATCAAAIAHRAGLIARTPPA